MKPERRLKDGELGGILRAADAEVSPERIARNGERVKQLIAAGGTLALWKLLVVLGLVGALAIPFVLRSRGGEAPRAPEVAIAADATAVPMIADAAIAHDDAAPAAVVVAEPPPLRHVHVAAPADAAPAEPPPPPPSSDLPAQIELYEAARAAAAAKDFTTALARIDELFYRFPATQLRSDAELARADWLARAGRTADAITAFEALAAADSHRGRRGELLRTLGDLLRRSGDCKRAVDAYTRALAEKLGERDRADALRGRDRCTPK